MPRVPLLPILLLGAAASASAGAKSLRFDFGTGPTEPGWVRVDPQTLYGQGHPYGIHAATRPRAVSRGEVASRRTRHLTHPDSFEEWWLPASPRTDVQSPEGN